MAVTQQTCPNVESVLFITDRTLTPRDHESLARRANGRRVMLLDLSPGEDVRLDESHVERLRIDELLDLNAFHREVRDFLDRWPRETLVDGRPFGDVFRQTTDDSLWWTGPGSLRHPFSGPVVPFLRAAWSVRSAVGRHSPVEVLWTVGDRRLATVLQASLQSLEIPSATLAESVMPLSDASRLGRFGWACGCVLSLATLPVWFVIRALYARLVTCPRFEERDESPAVVMSGWYPNHVRNDASGRPQVAYWQRLADRLRERHPQVRVRYLLHTTTFRFAGWQRLLRPFYNGWSRLRGVEGLLPLSQCYPELRTYVRATGHQLRCMRTYARWEASGGWQRSPRFAGVDVSTLLIPHLRHALGTMAKWSRNVAATAASLRAAGDVRGVLVHEEFYPKGMLTIAAARTLGLPTLGVQHGLIGPQHTVYMPPQGQIDDGPAPDWFAAYGAFAADVLNHDGDYPMERIAIVGAPRFDDLATARVSREAARDDLNWPNQQTVMLLTTETFRLSSPILRGLLPLVAEHSDRRLVVKLHPHDRNPEQYETLLADAGLPNVELVWDRLPERMSACDVLITGYSTTAIEALLLGKPMICADFTTSPDRYPFANEGVAVAADSPDQLSGAVRQVLGDPVDVAAREKFLRHHLGPTVDGRAADDFCELIMERFLGGSGEPDRSANGR